jgi:hypothetical protein
MNEPTGFELDSAPLEEKLAESEDLVLETTEGFSITATIGRRVVDLSATDRHGTAVNVYARRETSPRAARARCWVCIEAPNRSQICYEIDCDKLPEPQPPE